MKMGYRKLKNKKNLARRAYKKREDICIQGILEDGGGKNQRIDESGMRWIKIETYFEPK